MSSLVNVTLLQLETRRLLRNPRTLIFTVIVPIFFFLIFGLNHHYAHLPYGSGNVSSEVMINLALYGAILSAATGGAMVSLERSLGWSRQLRLTPLSPLQYVATKVMVALIQSFVAVAAVYVVGALTGTPKMPLTLWFVTGLCVWIGSLVFGAFGLFIGYLLPSENVMQLVGFSLMLFSFGGGLFIPLSQFSHAIRDVAVFTPLYGINQLVHFPLRGGSFNWVWLANSVGWFALFILGAGAGLRRDTKRV